MKFLKRLFLAAVLMLSFRPYSFGAEVVRNEDLALNIGGRFQEMGELEEVTDDPIRDQWRVYLFNVEDRLFVNGNYKGTQFYFEEALGGEALNSSNNQINLLEFAAQVPIVEGLSVMTGQFKLPVNLESADYDGDMLFTEKSELMELFFNAGYDTGLALVGQYGNLDAILGTVDGSPNLPQRYLPEYFNFPPMLIGRLGYTSGIKDDPFHPKQEGFDKLDNIQFGVHLNGIYVNDSNAGHSTDTSLQNSYFTTASALSYYGNALLSTAWNPFLGKTAQNYGRVNAQYWYSSVDAQFRAPVGSTTFTLQAQWNAAQFQASNFQPFTLNGQTVTNGALNINGGEVQASLGDNPLEIAGRFAMVIPDAGFAYTVANTYTSGPNKGSVIPNSYASYPITGSDQIYEWTGAITLHVNKNTKIVSEIMGLYNTPESLGNDGTYVIAEMPTQVTNASSTSPISRAAFVSVGRMLFQYSF